MPKEFPEGFVRYYKFDLAKMTTEFKPGIVLHLKPFPGVIAVAPDPNEPKEKAGPPIKDDKGRTSTLRPWKNGSNMDLNELQAGSTLYLPVFVKGALIWTGDSHCLQGNGEVNLEALECAYKEIEIQPIVRKDMKIEWPQAENKDYWIFTGFDEDLTEAMKIATRNTIDWLSSPEDGAYGPLRSLRAGFAGRRLPGHGGGGHPQGHPLHGAQVHFRKAVKDGRQQTVTDNKRGETLNADVSPCPPYSPLAAPSRFLPPAS